jgi:lipopolysaccharide export system ATP-binding protein
VTAGSDGGELSNRIIGVEAGLRSFLEILRGAPRRQRNSAAGFWDIGLASLGGRMTALHPERINLPSGRPSRRQKVPAKPPISEEVPLAPRQARGTSDESPARPARKAGAARAVREERDAVTVRDEVKVAPRRPLSGQDQGAIVNAPVQQETKAPPALPPQPRRNDSATRAPSRETRETYLAAHGVEKSFAGRKVVKGTSLYVRRGEAVGLLGPNGAGKTTVFYMITGLIKADRGRIELDGHDITHLPMYQRARLGVGYLPQEASIFRGLNVEDNIRAVLEAVEPNRKRREHDLNALLDEFNIARLRKTPSIALSGGERRRVEIARALATKPNYMLLDEPFAGIDPIAVGDIQTLVRHLTNRGIGVLITDHNVRETLGLTDRSYIFYSGEVLMEGRADDIVNDPEVRRLYLGDEFRM